MKILEVKPHPNSPEHKVAVFKTKVMHELCVDASDTEDAIKEKIKEYLRGKDIGEGEQKAHIKGYEDLFPDTMEMKENKEEELE